MIIQGVLCINMNSHNTKISVLGIRRKLGFSPRGSRPFPGVGGAACSEEQQLTCSLYRFGVNAKSADIYVNIT